MIDYHNRMRVRQAYSSSSTANNEEEDENGINKSWHMVSALCVWRLPNGVEDDWANHTQYKNMEKVTEKQKCVEICWGGLASWKISWNFSMFYYPQLFHFPLRFSFEFWTIYPNNNIKKEKNIIQNQQQQSGALLSIDNKTQHWICTEHMWLPAYTQQQRLVLLYMMKGEEEGSSREGEECV